jgi:hypothetical protein
MPPRWGQRRVPFFLHRSYGFGAGPGALVAPPGHFSLPADDSSAARTKRGDIARGYAGMRRDYGLSEIRLDFCAARSYWRGVDSIANRFDPHPKRPLGTSVNAFFGGSAGPYGIALASRGCSTGASAGCSTVYSQSNPALCPQSQTQRRLRASCFADISGRCRGWYVKCDLLALLPLAIFLVLAVRLAPSTLGALAIASPLATQRLLTAPARSCRSAAPRAVA